MVKQEYHYALGRRKSSTARVRLVPGTGKIIVNAKPVEDYFAGSKTLNSKIVEPFILLDLFNKYDATIVVSGGGHSSQSEAIRLAISKALVLVNNDFKSTLKRSDLLSRDSRDKERKKFGLKGARKQRQFTKR